MKTTVNGGTYTENFISVGRGIVLGSMTEDREVAPKAVREPKMERQKKALTPIASVSGSGSSSDSSMERLLQEVRALVVRSDPGATVAVAQPYQPYQPLELQQQQQGPQERRQPELTRGEPSSCTTPRDSTQRALLRIQRDPAFRRTKNAGYWDRHKAIKGLCHKCRQPGHKYLHCPLWNKPQRSEEGN